MTGTVDRQNPELQFKPPEKRFAGPRLSFSRRSEAGRRGALVITDEAP